MNTSSFRLPALLAIAGLACLLSCDDNPTDIVTEEPPLLPVPTIEYTRPIANTELTYNLLINAPENNVDVKVATAESTLAALVTAGIPVRDAWATGRDVNRTGSVFITVRLQHADTTIVDHGFDGGWTRPSSLDKGTRHYTFGPPSQVELPVKILEFKKLGAPPDLVYRLNWWPDAAFYGDYVLEREWRVGPEFMIRSLIEAGVVVKNAWVSATRDNCWWWGSRAILVEVSEPHPALEASGFVEGKWMDDEVCSIYMWNYCFTDCPDAAELPRPREIWTIVSPDPRRIYWRSVPSQEYEALFGRPGQIELHIMRMLRAGAPIQRAWFPVMAAAGDYTYIAIELSRIGDLRVRWWGYEDELAGGIEDLNRWSFVKYFDLRDVIEPPDEDPELDKKHVYEQEFDGDP